jgi:hypothetical protein
MSAPQPKLTLNMAGYVGARDHLVLLNNYEAGTDHFPFVYRPHVDPASATNNIKTSFGLQHYENGAGRRIDYVLVIGTRPRWLDGALFQIISRAPLGMVSEIVVYERASGV